MKYVGIGTDSWCQGEWHLIGNDLKVVHSGITRVLEDRYPLLWHYRPGGGNMECIDGLERHRDHLSAVVWLHTDPVRDLPHYSGWSRVVKSIDLFEKWVEHNQQVIAQRLDRLGVPVFMFGGACDLMPGIQGKNLHVEIASTAHWFDPVGYQPGHYYMENFRHRFLADWTDDQITKHFAPELINHFEAKSRQMDSMRSDRNLYPDGFHPALPYHRRLGEYLLDRLENFNLPKWKDK
jgi:hypothetical protein